MSLAAPNRPADVPDRPADVPDRPADVPAEPAPAAACPVDLARYPLRALEGAAGRRLIAEARARLAETGCLLLRNFVTPAGLAALQAETRTLAPAAHVERRFTNPYGGAPGDRTGDAAGTDPTAPPRQRFLERSNGFVGGDLIAPGTAARALYHDRDFQRFLAAVVGAPALHEYADPLAGLVVNVLRPGCTHPWHFDNTDFVVSLMTQQPEAGGAFEYCPGLRSAADENEAGVAAVLDGARAPVRTLDLRPGDLQVFFGRNALHRVAPVAGGRERHTLILGYTQQPGVIGDPARTRALFGRSTPAHAAAARKREGGAP